MEKWIFSDEYIIEKNSFEGIVYIVSAHHIISMKFLKQVFRNERGSLDESRAFHNMVSLM